MMHYSVYDQKLWSIFSSFQFEQVRMQVKARAPPCHVVSVLIL